MKQGCLPPALVRPFPSVANQQSTQRCSKDAGSRTLRLGPRLGPAKGASARPCASPAHIKVTSRLEGRATA